MRIFTATVLLLALPLPAMAQPATGASPAETFQKTKGQIKLLLDHRRNPRPFKPGSFNPFLAGAVTAAPDPDAVKPDKEPAPPLGDQALLEEILASIKITGSFERGGRFFISINQQPRREGDYIIVNHRGEPVNVLLKTIQDGRIVFALREAEFTLKF